MRQELVRQEDVAASRVVTLTRGAQRLCVMAGVVHCGALAVAGAQRRVLNLRWLAWVASLRIFRMKFNRVIPVPPRRREPRRGPFAVALAQCRLLRTVRRIAPGRIAPALLCILPHLPHLPRRHRPDECATHQE
jgi:hypothetical protein